ncbi:KilA-N domain-containing protein [Haploplasma axanthum]|uniref:KilA-N domain n=1 Tax=Haploplasma axanthum TaxID=29552 RepID=A0A449BDS2_HAPAX|nr:KilA-N domain-containing protein [Haploplasma axanthum]VEU80567.1 KilA-N domain [Haploplasma axanthum]
MAKKQVDVQGIKVSYIKIKDNDYISLTDIARVRESEFPSTIIQNWMRNKNTVEYLGVWEKLYNPNFNSIEFDRIDKESGRNSFMLTPKRWISAVNSIGIITKQGRYADTLAHRDIAFKFAGWLSVEFELYIIKEFQRLKQDESKLIEWNAKRELAKVNYLIHTDAIKENLIVSDLKKEQINYVYANESDMLNVALFGLTASIWAKNNPDKKGNMRDYATIDQLLVLSNLESYNAILIEQGLKQSQRIVQLNQVAKKQIEVLSNKPNGLNKTMKTSG